MKAQETTFQQIVQGEKQFQIPLYQRTYSWGRSELQKLWDDVVEQASLLVEGNPGTGHFIGSVVLAPSVVSPTGVQCWLVIDGQQRLTTLMLALCALRDHLAVESEHDGDRIHELFLVNKYRDGLQRYRLLPTQADRDSYTRCVDAAPDAGTGDSIGDAYRFFREALVGADDPDDLDDLTRIERVIAQRLSIVWITCETSDNVHRIFESLNNTGLGLSQADLLRNYVFMLLPTLGEQVYQTTWLPMQERLGARNLELLGWLDLVIRGDERARQGEAYEGQQRRLEPLSGDEEAVAAEVEEFARRSRLLLRIVKPDVHEQHPALQAAFGRLNAWGAQTAYPVLLQLLDLLDRERCSLDEVVEAVSYVESFLVRRMLAAVPTNNLNRIFSALTQELDGSVSPTLQVQEWLSARRRRWPTDDELLDSIGHKPFYWQGRASQRAFVLRRLEGSYGSKEPVDYSKAKLSVEHVLPQTMNDAWRHALVRDAEDYEHVEDLHAALIHTLGNLTLTADNPALGNMPFAKKREILSRSAFRMNQAIAEQPRWSRSEIIHRAEELYRRSADLWPAPLPAITEVNGGRDWGLLRRALAALPSGSWTTYGDVAELIGSHAVPVGQHLASKREPNAHRVLQRDGRIAPNFVWTDPEDDRDPASVLRAEGVRFDEGGRADASQRMTANDLADLLGMRELPEPVVPANDAQDLPLEKRFLALVQEHQGGEVLMGVQRLLDEWRRMGGVLEFGSSEETSCFTMLRSPTAEEPNRCWWPLALYPSGSAEVTFQHLTRRPPWDEQARRDDLRRRLITVDGIEIDASKLRLRPSFDIALIADERARQVLEATLEWFVVETMSAPRRP